MAINKTFYPNDIATKDDFNEIESKIVSLKTDLDNLGYTTTAYTRRYWAANNSLVYTWLNNLEQGIQNLANSYYKPYGWQEGKTWIAKISFSYKDLNRWVYDLNLMEQEIARNPYQTIWDGASFENWDSYDTGLEWED